MTEIIKFAVVLCLVLIGCTEKKQEKNQAEEAVTLEGMWQLRSGVWENEDGSLMRYPEDSITEGVAYIIYSKKHYMLIAEAPKMDYYRGELINYSIDGDKLTVSASRSNFKENIGVESVWTFRIENNFLSAENGNNREVWERVE